MSYIQSNALVTLPAANVTLVPADSGKIFLVSQAAAYAITLPYNAVDNSVPRGVCYSFILVAAAAHVVAINGPPATTIVRGHAVVGPDDGATLNVSAGNLGVQFSTTCVLGDRIDIVCDGTSWYARGTSGSNVQDTGIIFAN